VSPPLCSQTDTGDRSFVGNVHPVYYSTQLSESFGPVSHDLYEARTQLSESFGPVSHDLYEARKDSHGNLSQFIFFAGLDSKKALLEYAKHVKAQARQLSKSSWVYNSLRQKGFYIKF
jgi:hypothetical protein